MLCDETFNEILDAGIVLKCLVGEGIFVNFKTDSKISPCSGACCRSKSRLSHRIFGFQKLATIKKLTFIEPHS